MRCPSRMTCMTGRTYLLWTFIRDCITYVKHVITQVIKLDTKLVIKQIITHAIKQVMH